MRSDLKEWSYAHRAVLSIAAVHALRLKENPQNIVTSLLILSLSPSGKQEPQHLKVDAAYAVPLDMIRMLCDVRIGLSGIVLSFCSEILCL